MSNKSGHIGPMLRDHLHLSNDEIEAYVEGTLEGPSRDLVAGHLRCCASCTREVQVIQESFAEDRMPLSEFQGKELRGKSIHLRPLPEYAFPRFWVGDSTYPLNSIPSRPGILLVSGLSQSEFLRALEDDSCAPGSNPIGIEGLDPEPLIIPCAGFQLERYPTKGSGQSGGLRATAEIVNRSVEVFSHSDSSEVFLKVGENIPNREKTDRAPAAYGPFGMDWLASSTVLSLKRLLVEEDIKATEKEYDRREKIAWSAQWESQIAREFVCLEREEPHEPFPQFLDDYDLNIALPRLRARPIEARMILLEIVAFEPYASHAASHALAGKMRIDMEGRRSFLLSVSRDLGLEESLPDRLDACLQSAVSSLTGNRRKIVLGIAVGMAFGALIMGVVSPLIGGLIGKAMGLKGAAARMAGLAVLGGGAVAKGGFGVVGGTAVLAMAGALLGMLTGALTARIMVARVSRSAVIEGVKLEVAIREFLLQGEAGDAHVQRLLLQQRRRMELMETEIRQLRLKGQSQARRIKDLESTLAILKQSHKRGEDMLAGAA